MSLTENKYYNHAMRGLIDSTKNRKYLEKNFERSKMQEYENTCLTQLSCCVELLKLGVECTLKDETVFIPTHDEDAGIVSFPQDEVKEKIGEETFYILFPKPEEPVKEEPEENEEEKLLEDEKEIIRTDNPWQSFNPFSMFLPFLTMSQSIPYATNQQRNVDNNSLLDNPILAVQEEIETLKAEKIKLKNIAKRYKTELEEVKTTYGSDSSIDLHESKKLADDNKLLSQSVENLKTELNEQVSTNLRLRQDINAEKSKNAQLSQNIADLSEQLKKQENKQKDALVSNDAEITSLKKQLESTKSKNTSLEKKIALSTKENEEEKIKLLDRIHKLESDVENYNSRIEELIQKLYDAEHQKNSEIKAESTEEDNSAVVENTIEETAEELDPSGFEYDEMLNIRTMNDFEKVKSQKLAGDTLGYIIIPGYFDFVEAYGQLAANETLKGTAMALRDEFGSDNVFRSDSDGFVITTTKKVADVKNTLKTIAERLDKSLEFDIMYAVAKINNTIGNTFLYLTELRKKNKLYGEYKITEDEIAEKNARKEKQRQKRKDKYKDDSSIDESDATTLDLARQLIAMQAELEEQQKLKNK